MKTILATVATIQFVGLCMFTPGDGTHPVHVLLPRVEGVRLHDLRAGSQPQHDHIHLVSSVPKQPKDKTPPTAAKDAGYASALAGKVMDGHSAIIAFEGTPLKGSNWLFKALRPVPQYHCIELDGEHVQFLVSADQPKPLVPTVLPRVKNGCKRERKLNNDHNPPHYRKAAGVVKISAGQLSACSPIVNGQQSMRIDTSWTFNTNEPIVIETTNHKKNAQKKRIVLDASTVVIVANVPTAWLNSAPGSYAALADESHHYKAFYTMLTGSADGCSHAAARAPSCGGIDFKFDEATPTRGDSKPQRVPRTAFMETYSCSNSQYP